jgi:hypothetical protein
VHRRDVELRRRRIGGEVREARLAEVDVLEAGGSGKGAGIGDVAGLKSTPSTRALGLVAAMRLAV